MSGEGGENENDGRPVPTLHIPRTFHARTCQALEPADGSAVGRLGVPLVIWALRRGVQSGASGLEALAFIVLIASIATRWNDARAYERERAALKEQH